MRDAFSDCHPMVNLVFYIGVFIMGMCFTHPAFLLCSTFFSFAYYRIIKKKFLKYFVGMMGLLMALAVINPIFNTQGERVLFTYLGDRAYTFEAVCYGIALGAMFVTILTWFSTYTQVMSSDKFLYCFGKFSPSVSLIFTMVLRLVPSFQRKADQISSARRCIGKSADNGSRREKIEHGMLVTLSLTSWALEGGVIMADSMKSRGYGTGKRSFFSIYKMRSVDRILLGLMAVLICIIIGCAVGGGMYVTYSPQMYIVGTECLWTVLGVISYFIFLSIPTAMNIMEAIKWYILKSKI